MTQTEVRGQGGWPGSTEDLLAEAREAVDSIDRCLLLAGHCGRVLPAPGEGRTRMLWEALAALAAVDLTVARVVEPHLDALAILRQAGCEGLCGGDERWGVFAAEHPRHRLDARQDASGWTVSGVKVWCSLADRLDRAVVTAHTSHSTRRAFAIDLHSPRVVTEPGQRWVARGLREVVSLSITCRGVKAAPVGPDGWYLTRPGFAWGGIGVAACWYGGALGLLRGMRRAAQRRTADQVALMLFGLGDAHLAAARAILAESAARVDAGEAGGVAGALLAARARAVVADAAERVLEHSGHALGPGPLATDPGHAARVADLQLYLRQHHAERDAVRLARLALEAGTVRP